MSLLTTDVSELELAILSMNRLKARKIVFDSMKKAPPIRILDNLIVPVLEQIGQRWENGTIALSQVYVGSRMCEDIVKEVFPAADPAVRPYPVLGICSFLDFHNLGKRIISSILQSSGYTVIDLGTGLNQDELIVRVQEHSPEILLISTLMLPSALRIKDAIIALRSLRLTMPVIVGGAPFRLDHQLWKEINADGFGSNSSDALEVIRNLAGVSYE